MCFFLYFQSFVHVSSAFANCLVLNASEKYYTEYLDTTSDKLLQIKNVLGGEMLNRMEGEIMGKFPNTYCLTKSLAEEAVLTKANNLPMSIFRPGISMYCLNCYKQLKYSYNSNVPLNSYTHL